MVRKDQLSTRLELTHGCSPTVISKKLDTIFWSNLTIRDPTPHKLHPEKTPVWEEPRCLTSLNRMQPSVVDSMTWPTSISRLLQVSSLMISCSAMKRCLKDNGLLSTRKISALSWQKKLKTRMVLTQSLRLNSTKLLTTRPVLDSSGSKVISWSGQLPLLQWKNHILIQFFYRPKRQPSWHE